MIDFFAGMTFSKNRKERASFLRNARNALRKNGKLVVGTYDRLAETISGELGKKSGFEVLNDFKSKNPGRKTINRVIIMRKK
jgi:hypothetical protein